MCECSFHTQLTGLYSGTQTTFGVFSMLRSAQIGNTGQLGSGAGTTQPYRACSTGCLKDEMSHQDASDRGLHLG
jgi:hypothetical protein